MVTVLCWTYVKFIEQPGTYCLKNVSRNLPVKGTHYYKIVDMENKEKRERHICPNNCKSRNRTFLTNKENKQTSLFTLPKNLGNDIS